MVTSILNNYCVNLHINIKDPSNILNHSRCYRLMSLLTDLLSKNKFSKNSLHLGIFYESVLFHLLFFNLQIKYKNQLINCTTCMQHSLKSRTSTLYIALIMKWELALVTGVQYEQIFVSSAFMAVVPESLFSMPNCDCPLYIKHYSRVENSGVQ